MPSKAQSIVARMRQIPVPKPSSRPVTPKTEPAGDAPGFATPPPPAKASTPVPSPVSPPVTPTVRESPGTLILIDLEEPVAPTVSEREAAASAQEAHLHNTAAVETAVGGGSGEKKAPLAEEREPQKDAPEVEALPKESAKAPGGSGIRLQGELEKLGGEQLSELCEAARRHPDLPRLLCNELGIEEWSAEGREAIKEFGEAEPLDELLSFHTEIAEEQALKDAKAPVDTTPSPAPAKTTPPPAPATTTPPPPAKSTPPQPPAKSTPPQPLAKSTPLQPPAKSTPPQPPAKSTGAGGIPGKANSRAPKAPAQVSAPPTPKQPVKPAFTEIPPAATAPVNFQVVGNVPWPSEPYKGTLRPRQWSFRITRSGRSTTRR